MRNIHILEDLEDYDFQFERMRHILGPDYDENFERKKPKSKTEKKKE